MKKAIETLKIGYKVLSVVVLVLEISEIGKKAYTEYVTNKKTATAADKSVAVETKTECA